MFSLRDMFFISMLIQAASILAPVFIGGQRRASALAHITLVAGLITGFISSFLAVFFPMAHTVGTGFFGLPPEYFRFDPLALYFLCVVQAVAIPTAVFSYSYLEHYIGEGRSVKSLYVFFAGMLIATQMVVTINHAIVFLVFWEATSMSAYLGMIFEKEKKEVQKGSFYYFVMNHVVIFLLYIFFFILHRQTGSWLLSDFRVVTGNSGLTALLFLLALAAFGMKAGFMPFHFWLPRAHPIAPSTISAFLSGIIIKLGIYGLFRAFQILSPAPLWIGWLVLVVSMITAIFGVWYALAQHDIKKLLAYHSVENIGIIGIGMGIGFIGSAYANIPMQILGFGGALLHVLNHAVFKSLLFLGSGVINNNLGTRNIELMGGIVHKAGFFVFLFLTGSVAICGIPPLNGFVSEFIIFNSFFTAARELKEYYPLMMLVSAVGLAFVGGLAVACFTKINAIMFLGTQRGETKPFHVSAYDYISLGVLALLCVVIGFCPVPFINAVNNVVSGIVPQGGAELLNINWLYITVIFTLFSAVALAMYFISKAMRKKFGFRESDAWCCGYNRLGPRMQYTASSFADQINDIARAPLGYHKKGRAGEGIFPPSSGFESHSADLVDNRIIVPGYKKFISLMSAIRLPGNTDIRYYVAYILIMIIVYSVVGFLWH
jgi:formate hydrogenlyase subunit 3/multisubunit Na+/H+ antiporter MnhD subunit